MVKWSGQCYLPDPSIDVSKDNTVFSLPRNDLESKILGIISSILCLDESTVDCNRSLFDLGGNSLIAIQLIHKIREILGFEITVIQLFANPTVYKIHDLLMSPSSSLKSIESSTSSIDMLQLKIGDPSLPPLVLINPAGSSGLWLVIDFHN